MKDQGWAEGDWSRAEARCSLEHEAAQVIPGRRRRARVECAAADGTGQRRELRAWGPPPSKPLQPGARRERETRRHRTAACTVVLKNLRVAQDGSSSGDSNVERPDLLQGASGIGPARFRSENSLVTWHAESAPAPPLALGPR